MCVQGANGQRGCGHRRWGVDRGCTPPHPWTATEVVGMHPTGMHACVLRSVYTLRDLGHHRNSDEHYFLLENRISVQLGPSPKRTKINNKLMKNSGLNSGKNL